MTPPARGSTENTFDDDDVYPGDDFASPELHPGERIGRPLNTGGHRWLRWSVALSIALGGGWVLVDDRATVPAWLKQMAARSPATETQATAPSAAPEPQPLPPLASTEVITPPTAAPLVATLPPPQGESPPTDAGSTEPLAPPTVDDADPYQKKALAVGLHPGISSAVLKRLSPADYRNAGIAIQKAIAEALDTDIFAWPKPGKPELALFQVRFVPGSNPDCRRYVVNVTKDGWSTTAPPMEKCGVRPPGPKANRAAVE